AQAFVDKTITYESSPSSGYVTSAMFAAEYLWPGTDSGLSKDKIGNESFPGYYTLTKLYERLGNESPQAVINAIEQGQEFMNHCGHGWIDVMSCGTGSLRNSHMDGLYNPGKFGVFYSIGCWTTAYDYDCIAEHFIFNPNGGGIGFIGNSSYGWGSPGNPTFGYSDRFDQRFYHEIFIEDHHRLGEALARDKIHYIPYSREKNVYRWHQYQLNLLGDPSVMVYTEEPKALIVDVPDSLPVSSSGVIVTVRDGNSPIEGGFVSLRKGGEWLSRTETDREGKAVIAYQFQTTGQCTLMVSAHNYLPGEKVITVFSAPFPNPVSYLYDDRLGNNDSIPNPNETIYFTPTIKNEGGQATQSLDLTLRIGDPDITVQDSTESTGPLNPGEEVILTDGFQFDVGSVNNGHTGYFELEIQSGSRNYRYTIPIQIGLPVFEITKIRFLDPPPMPGDSDDVRIYLKNEGLGYGHSSYAQFSTSDPELTLYTDSIYLGEVPPDGELMKDLPIGISSSCPLGHIGMIITTFQAQGYTGIDTIAFVVGETGFVDSMESGPGKWHSGGSNNLWHLTEYRSHSPTHSFYCGNESNHQYVNNMDCYIETDPIILDQDYELRFWRYFITTIYGTDGLYVIIRNNNSSDTLDFIGSGGALEGKEIPGDWFEEVYSLSKYQLGDTIRLRLSFVSDSDGDVAEGFYVDDVYIGPKLPGVQAGIDDRGKQNLIRPNPFSDLLLINLRSDECEISLINSLGQTLQTVKPKARFAMIDTKGLPSGVYFIRIEDSEETTIRKVVKIR
ncbi:MAG TPA: T9SS type A sorting domain-containing protein, partial [bacterium (Candidatus Stahlbacteria)]|nr:T9SS type A sorting domain-containing protein [Candidatus Stahlbacteria bacterium]